MSTAKLLSAILLFLTTHLVACNPHRSMSNPQPTYTLSIEQRATATPTPRIINGIGNRKMRLLSFPESPYISSIVINSSRITFDEEVCVHINERALWRPGHTAQSMQMHFSSSQNFNLEINGQPVDTSNFYRESSLVEFFELIESTSEATGQIEMNYGRSAYCVNIAQLPSGTYDGTLNLITLSQDSYSYTWQFEIFQTDSP